MTPTELIDSARTTTRDRLAEVDTDALRESAATSLAHARETAGTRLHDAREAAETHLTEASRYLETKVDEASDALEDDETRSRALGIAAGITGLAVLLWALRRRRRAKQEAELEEALYESTMEGIPGWTDPLNDEVEVIG